MSLWESYFGAVRSGNWKKAIDILKKIQEEEPDNPQVFLKVGDAYQRLGDIERAVPAYIQAAHLILKDGFLQKALAVYKIILRLDPHNQEAITRSRDLLMEIETAKLKTVPEPEISLSREETESPFLIPEFMKMLPQNEVKKLMAELKTLAFAPDEIVIEEGDSGDSIYFIISGRARVTTHVLGRAVELAMLQRGDFFGEVAFLTGRPRTATVKAMEQMEVLEFTRPVLEDLLERYPEVLKTLQDFYYSRLENTLKKVKTSI